MYYTDNTGLQHESYSAACIYYGADTPEQLAAESRAEEEEWNVELQDMMEARGGPFLSFPQEDDFPF